MKKALFAFVLFFMSASVQAGLQQVKNATPNDQKRNQGQDFRSPAPAPAPVAQAPDLNRMVVTHLTNTMDSSIVPPANLSNERESTNLKVIKAIDTLIPNTNTNPRVDLDFNAFSTSEIATELYTGTGLRGGSDYAMYNSSGPISSTSGFTSAQITLDFKDAPASTPKNPVVTAVSNIGSATTDASRTVLPKGDSTNPNINPDINAPMIDMSNPNIQNISGQSPKEGLHFDFSSILTPIKGFYVKGVRVVTLTCCVDLTKLTPIMQNLYAYWGKYVPGESGVIAIPDVTIADVNYASIFTFNPADFGVTFNETTNPPTRNFPTDPNKMGTYSSSDNSAKLDRCVIRLALALPYDTMEWLFIAPGLE